MQMLAIAGTVGRDAELRNTQNGDSVLNFSIAVDNGKDSNGNKRDASWFDCAVWGKRATGLANHIKKGDKLALTGRPTARAHDGKAYLGINVDNLTFQGGSQRQEQGHRDQGGYDDPGEFALREKHGGQSGHRSSDLEDEIPF